MVGVPGKDTTGCHTCRRRKIKCDRGQPDCMKCTKSGRQCEGYERGAVFLNRTAKGLSKRRYLDDVKSRTPAPTSSMTRTEAAPMLFAYRPSQMRSLPTDLYGFFLDTWLPPRDKEGSPFEAWLADACAVSGRSALLQRSLGALCTTLVGWKRNDAALVHHGHSIYGQALQALQLALWDPNGVFDEDTLIACQTLKLYEITQSTHDSIRGYDSHVDGAVMLLTHRGPQRCNTPLSKSLLMEIRYSGMIKSIQYMKRSPLGEAHWQASTRWTSRRAVASSLHDRGYAIGALTADVKLLMAQPPRSNAAALAISYLARAIRIAQSLDEWHISAVQGGWLSSDWPYPILADLPEQTGSLEDRKSAVDFSLLRESYMMLDYWALSIALSIFITSLSSKLPPQVPILDTARAYGPSFQLQLAKKIWAVVPYQSREEHGFVASSRTLFAVRTSLFPLRRYPEEEYQELRTKAEMFVGHLTSLRGLKYATSLSKVSGDWGDTRGKAPLEA